MTTKDTTTIVVILRNGHRFEHEHARYPESKLMEFINEILAELTKRSGGILTLPNPYGIYQMKDISSILFPDIVPDAKTLSLGFHPDTK